MANEIRSVLTYNANLSSAMAEIKGLTAQVGMLNVSMNSLDATALKLRNDLALAFSANVGAIGGFTAKMTEMSTAADTFGKRLAANKLTMREYFQEAARGITKQDSLMRQFARNQVRYLESTTIAMGRGANGKQMGMVITPNEIDLKNSATRMKVLNQEFNTFKHLVNSGANEMINFGKNTQWTGRQLTVGLTMPVVLFGATFAKTFMDIDKELTRFAKVYGQDLVGSNGVATERMKQQVMDLAKTISSQYGVAASETAGLAADIAATGKEGQDLLDTVAQTSRLAVLGEVDRKEAMKATLAIQTAFKQNTNELAESINFLNAVENQTSTSLNDLVEAIPKAGPVIQGLGGSIKDLSVLMVAMKEGGIPASEAANAIKSGMASLINPTKKAADTAKEFGVNLTGIVEANKGQLMPTLFALQDSLDGLDSFSRSRVIEEIFGKYQFARISALFNNLGKAGSQTEQAMKLAGASTAELASVANSELKAYTESTTVRFQRMMETVKNQLLPVGEQLLKLVTPALEKLSSVLSFLSGMFDKLPDPVKNFLGVLGGFALVAGPILMLVGLFKQLIGNSIKFGMSIVSLGARLAGLKPGKLEVLDEQAIAAKTGIDKLTGAFVTQETAVKNLNTELAIYLTALKRASTQNPQMFTPVARGRAPIRRADGGGVPGGYGGGDIVPALLEPGEFVVRKEAAMKYGGVLRAMNGGYIQGYQKAGEVVEYARAHVTPPKYVNIQDSGFQTRFLPQLGDFSRTMIEADINAGKQTIRAFSNLVLLLTKEVNDELNLKRASRQELIKQIQTEKAWEAMMKRTGLTFSELQPVISHLTTNLNKLQTETINDATLYAHMDTALQELTTQGDRAAGVLSKLAKQYGSFEVASGRRENFGAAAGPGYKGKISKARIPFQERAITADVSQYFIVGEQIVQQAETAVLSGMRSGLGVASPSREAKIVGEQTAQGLLLGIKELLDDAKNAGQQLASQFVAGSQLYVPGRGTPPSGPLILPNQGAMPSGPIILPNQGSIPSGPLVVPEGFKRNQPQRQPVFLGMPTLREGMDSVRDTDEKKRGLLGSGKPTMALFAATGILSSLGMFNEGLGNATAGLTNFLFAVSSITSALDMISMFKGGAGGAAGKVGMMSRLGSFIGIGSTAAAAGAGAGGVGAGAGAGLGAAAGGAGLAGVMTVAAPVAAALAVVAGTYLLIKKNADDAKEAQLAAFKDPLKTMEYFGKSMTDIKNIIQNTNAKALADDVAQVNEQLREAVKTDYATLIEKLKTSLSTTGAQDLGAAYTKMIISGMTSDEAKAAVSAIATEAGAAGGNAYAQAMKLGLLGATDAQGAMNQVLARFDPNSKLNQDLRAAREAEASARVAAGPVMVGGRFAGYAGVGLAQQARAAQQPVGPTGAEVSSALENLTLMYQQDPEYVAKNIDKITEAFMNLESTAGPFLDQSEVAWDTFKNKIGEADPGLNSVMDSLQDGTKETQALAMKMVALNISLYDARDAAGRFSTAMANAAIESRIKMDILANAVDAARQSLIDLAGTEMQAAIDASGRAIDAKMAERNKYIKEREAGAEALSSSSNGVSDAIQDEIKELEKEQAAIEKSANKYVEAIQKRQKADDYYLQKTKSRLSAMQQLASGDVFGFLQTQAEMAGASQQFSAESEIARIEARKQKEVDALQAQIDKKQELADLASQAHQDAMAAYDAETKARTEQFDKELEEARRNKQQMQELSDKLKEGQIVNSFEVMKSYGKDVAEKYSNEVREFIVAQQNMLNAQVLAGQITSASAKQSIEQMIIGVTGGPGMGVGVTVDQLVRGYLGADYRATPTSSPVKAAGPALSAQGGYISGPGTSTSDSIPARLSDGEYVIKASSVNKYGVGMMDQINAGTFAMGGIVKKTMMPRYNMGGMVAQYALGGPVGGNTYNISINADGVSDVNKLADIIVRKISAETDRRQHSRSMR